MRPSADLLYPIFDLVFDLAAVAIYRALTHPSNRLRLGSSHHTSNNHNPLTSAVGSLPRSHSPIAASNYWMSRMNLAISPDQVIWPRAGLVVGLAIVFAPVNVAAYLYTPPLLRGAAVGLLSLLRNEGGSVGTSLAQTLQERREQFHTLRLGESLDPFNPAVQSFLEQAQARFLRQTGDPAAAQQLAWQALENLRHQQASALAYFDCFWLFAVVILAATLVVFLMKRSVAEKGAPIGGE